MLSINMRIFKTILIVLSVLLIIIKGFDCSPVSSSLRAEHRGGDDDGLELSSDNLTNLSSELSSSSSLSSSKDDYFDQRQNGTENYRIHVDGLVVVVAPIEALLLAASNTDLSDNYFPINNNNKTDIIKPDNTTKPEQSKPIEILKPTDDKINEKTDLNNKINQKSHFKISSLLGPMLKKLMNQST